MNYILLKENIQRSRKILKSINRDESDENYIKIKEIVGAHVGFLGMFTFLFFEKKYKLKDLSDLLATILSNKKLLQYLPKEVVKYDNIEELGDDLLNLSEWALYNREFVSRLTSNLKKEAKKDSTLKDAYIHLDDDVKSDLLNNFIPKVSRYKEYTEFKNDCIYYINKNGQDILDVAKQIEETKGIYTIYNNDNILIAEVYNKQASCKMGSKSWCISGSIGGSWDSYAGLSTGNKQYFIWNFNVSSSNIDSQVGVTIKADGSQKTSHLKNDEYVDINKYKEKYDIPNVLTPMDISVDIPKILDSLEFNSYIMSLLLNNDLVDEYIDKIPVSYKYIYGLVSADKLETISDFRRYIYSKEKHIEIKSLIRFCNMLRDSNKINEFLEKNKNLDILNKLQSLDFRDKIFIIDKYINGYMEEYHSDDSDIDSDSELTDESLYLFFHKEIEELEDTHPLKFDVNRHDDTFTLSLKYDKGDYIYDILDISDESYYYELEKLGSYYGILDDIDFEEFNSIPYYLTKKGDKKLREYFEFIMKYTTHPILLDKLNSIYTDANFGSDKNNIEFKDVFDIIGDNIDPNFTNPYSTNSYFDDFWSSIVSSADDLLKDDAREYENTKIGEFDENKEVWEVNIDDIIENIKRDENIFDLNKPYTISDWLNSSPSSVSDMSLNTDYISASSYLSAADASEANEKLISELDDVINDRYKNIDTEDFENKKRYMDFLNKSYTPITEDSNKYNIGDWFGYKRSILNYVVIIPLKSIDKLGYMTVYYIPNSIINDMDDTSIEYDYQNKRFYFSSDLDLNLEKGEDSWGGNKSKIEFLNEKGITYKRIYIEDIIEGEEFIDPDQFKFERIKTFNDFRQTKIR